MRQYKSYDHRLKLLVIEAGDVEKFSGLGIPKSTMRTWIIGGIKKSFVTLDIFDKEKRELCQRIIEL